MGSVDACFGGFWFRYVWLLLFYCLGLVGLWLVGYCLRLLLVLCYCWTFCWVLLSGCLLICGCFDFGCFRSWLCNSVVWWVVYYMYGLNLGSCSFIWVCCDICFCCGYFVCLCAMLCFVLVVGCLLGGFGLGCVGVEVRCLDVGVDLDFVVDYVLNWFCLILVLLLWVRLLCLFVCVAVDLCCDCCMFVLVCFLACVVWLLFEFN